MQSTEVQLELDAEVLGVVRYEIGGTIFDTGWYDICSPKPEAKPVKCWPPLNGGAMRTDGAVEEVFLFWREQLSNGRSHLDEKRSKAIAARLRDGYSVEDLKLAVLGCKGSDFHMGNNQHHKRYTSIELICRDADHVDQFIEVAERQASKEIARIANAQQASAARTPPPADVQAKIDALLGRSRRAETPR